MLLDTSFEVNPNGESAPRLAEIRRSLTSVYPQVGPIWAYRTSLRKTDKSPSLRPTLVQ